MSDDYCEKYHFPRAWCAHCTPAENIAAQYELVPAGLANGYPIVELLRDGGPIHEFDEHFRFGRSKAKLILAAMENLERFSRGEKIKGGLVSDSHGNSGRIIVQFWPDFMRSDGRYVNASWLSLEDPMHPGSGIGIGYQKSLACIALKDEILRWVQSQRG